MDWLEKQESINAFIKKYRCAAAVVLAGIFLMTLTTQEKTDSPAIPVSQEIRSERDSLEKKLEEILCCLDGAGNVKVLLSISEGSEQIYQTDDDVDQSEGSQSRRRETVIITSSEREQHGLVQRIDPPRYCGAVILCQGADRAEIRLAVVEAVSTATGLGSDKISVLKMK